MQECDFARSTLFIHGFSGCDIPRKYSNSVIHIVLIFNIKDIISVLLNDKKIESLKLCYFLGFVTLCRQFVAFLNLLV